jgi:hypothetical protein
LLVDSLLSLTPKALRRPQPLLAWARQTPAPVGWRGEHGDQILEEEKGGGQKVVGGGWFQMRSFAEKSTSVVSRDFDTALTT